MRTWLSVFGFLSLALSACAQNPLALQAQNSQLQQQQLAVQQRAQELESRAHSLDQDNQELQTVVAQAKQQTKLLEDQLAALKDQLSTTTSQLAQLKEDKQLSEQQLESMAASTRRRTGAIITANNSLARNVPALRIPGVETRVDGDVIRVELPADRIFNPGAASLASTGTALIDTVGSEIARNYANHMIGIEGHTDSEPTNGATGTDNLQFSANRAGAVYQYLTSRRLFAANQLFTVGHGANHPVVSNATPGGRTRNNRVELVIYPEQSR